MVIRVSDKTQNYSKVTKLLVKPKELKSKELKEITLDDFKLQHDFDIIWEKESIYADKYLSISEEFI